MMDIACNQVTLNYGFGPVLDGLSLEIASGDRIAIVGRNGTGKTSLLRLIAGQDAPTSGQVNTRRGATIGYLAQIPERMGEGITTRDVLMRPFEGIAAIERRMRELEARLERATEGELDRLLRAYAHAQADLEAQGGYDVQETLARIVSGFALGDLLDRPFDALSGGQKTIALLAQTLMRAPDILLLDEPTNHLDLRALEWFEGFLCKARGTVVMVSHDRAFLDRVATRTVLLEGGRARSYAGNYTRAMELRERELLEEFERYKTQQRKIAAMKAAIQRYYDWGDRGNNEDLYRKAKELTKRLARMETIDRPQIEARHVPMGFAGGQTSKDVVRATDLTLCAGDLTLIEGAELIVRAGERVALLGENGVGKTTLVRALIGEAAPRAGDVFVAPSARVGYIPQEIRFEDEAASVLRTFMREATVGEAEARNALARYFFVGEEVYKRIGKLSGGEKVLLKLALLMRREIDMLVLDEPTNHIDIDTREILEDALLRYRGTLLFVSHDRYFIEKVATRIVGIRERKLVGATGGYAAYRAAMG